MKFFFLCSKGLTSIDDPIIANSKLHGDQDGAQVFRVFSHAEIKSASNFCGSEKIGRGGFGSVYRGRLKDGTMVGIKVLAVELESMRGERQFVSELAVLSTIRHENLVTLKGCCVNGGAKRYLVYDYMVNNSLYHTFLGAEQNRVKFTWRRRREVTLRISRGLAYLHEEVQPYIIHRDIKGSNILLDENFTPKIADFGLSKVFRSKTSHISTRVAGTIGYLAPEYALSGHLSQKSDVYSFGVLLLEIFSGKPVMDFNVDIVEQYLVDKAFKMYKADTLLQLIDPALKGDFPQEEAIRFLKIGLVCVQEKSKLRPKMSMVVNILQDEIDLSNKYISQPGIVDDLMDVKIGGHGNSPASFYSKRLNSESTNSPKSILLDDHEKLH